MLRTPTGAFVQSRYSKETDLEDAIRALAEDLFGEHRVYLEVKRRIGAKGKKQNIPDAYLLDLTSRTPRLYVVEVELTRHHYLKHIAVQLLEFSLAFEASRRRVGEVLLEAIAADEGATERCQTYCEGHTTFRNVDHLVDALVHADFSALVIIDTLEEGLAEVLDAKLGFPVDVIEVRPFADQQGEVAYWFEPFLADLPPPPESGTAAVLPPLDPEELDTIVVPARDEGFEDVFVAEDRWRSVRIHAAMRPQIKYCAAYRVAPISAITHLAPVRAVRPWHDTGKWVIEFDSPAEEIGPIPLVRDGRVKAPQSIRYTSRARIEAAKTLDDIW